MSGELSAAIVAAALIEAALNAADVFCEPLPVGTPPAVAAEWLATIHEAVQILGANGEDLLVERFDLGHPELPEDAELAVAIRRRAPVERADMDKVVEQHTATLERGETVVLALPGGKHPMAVALGAGWLQERQLALNLIALTIQRLRDRFGDRLGVQRATAGQMGGDPQQVERCWVLHLAEEPSS